MPVARGLVPYLVPHWADHSDAAVPAAHGVLTRRREDDPMRYFLIAVAIGASLGLGWLALSLVIGRTLANLAVWVAMLALAMAVAAVGLIRRRSWGAYVLSAAALLGVLAIAILMLFVVAYTWETEPDSTVDPGMLILWGALGSLEGHSLAPPPRPG